MEVDKEISNSRNQQNKSNLSLNLIYKKVMMKESFKNSKDNLRTLNYEKIAKYKMRNMTIDFLINSIFKLKNSIMLSNPIMKYIKNVKPYDYSKIVNNIQNKKDILKEYLFFKNNIGQNIRKRMKEKTIDLSGKETNNKNYYYSRMTNIDHKKITNTRKEKIILIQKNIRGFLRKKIIYEEDDDFCHYYTKDMQKKSGILITSLWYNPQRREDDELILEENLADDKKVKEINDEKLNEKEEKEKQNERKNDDDFDENIYYKEIVRLGLNIKTDIIEDNDVTPKDLIDYLRDICCEGNIYTPNYDFHINLPKFLPNNIELENQDEKKSESVNNSKNDSKKEFKGLYWDLGWLDLKNKLYYETSCNFEIDNYPNRLIFFEKFVEFLQAFIDKKIYDSLFSFFGYNNSILAGSDRFLPKNIFISTLNEILIDENIAEKDGLTSKRNQQMMKEKNNFMNYICNILCGFDEEMNIRDDSISFNLLKKKISSNLKNFQ